MIPKRPDYFCKLTAEQLGVSEDLVKDTIEIYWKEIRKCLTELKHPSIYVKGIGTFNIKSWNLAEVKSVYQYYSSTNNGSSFRKMAIKADMDDRIAKIKLIEEILEKNKVKKQEVKIKVIKLRHDKSNITNLEKQSSNNRGSLEQNIQEGSGRGSISEENEDMQSMPPPRQDG